MLHVACSLMRPAAGAQLQKCTLPTNATQQQQPYLSRQAAGAPHLAVVAGAAAAVAALCELV